MPQLLVGHPAPGSSGSSPAPLAQPRVPWPWYTPAGPWLLRVARPVAFPSALHLRPPQQQSLTQQELINTELPALELIWLQPLPGPEPEDGHSHHPQRPGLRALRAELQSDVLCRAMLCRAMLCCSVPFHALLCHAVLCRAMLFCAVPCCAELCPSCWAWGPGAGAAGVPGGCLKMGWDVFLSSRKMFSCSLG